MSSFNSDDSGRTPKKKKRRSNAQNKTFDSPEEKYYYESEDPIILVTVPVKSPIGPLQGGARVIKDHCADWYNYINKWDGLNDKGLAIVNKIVTARLQTQEDYYYHQLNTEDGESSEVASMRDKDNVMETDSHGNMDTQIPEGLEDMCNDLSDVYRSMEKLVNKMASITKHLRGVCEMQRNMAASEGSQPMFLTWPVHFFWEASCHLEEMYTKELNVKKAINEDVAHVKSRDVLMTYTSTWVHQPYIDDDATKTVESMLKETGHR